MKNFVKLLGVIALAAVISFSMAACSDDGGSSNNNDTTTTTTTEKTQLTGTVTVTQNVTFSMGAETMTLTADVSGLNGTSSSSYAFQWTKDGANISGATHSTYTVTEADYGKAVSVKVTYLGYNYTGEQIGTFTVPNPTTLTLKKNSSTWSQETGITIERVDGSYWKSVSSGGSSTWGSLSATGATVTLSSWTETKFKMRTSYTMIETKFYFKKDNAAGSDQFDLTSGTKTYTLENIADSLGLLTGLFAKEGA